MTNFAYMMSQEEFKHLWFNFNTVFGHDMSGPNSQEDVFTAEEYQHYYDGMLARDKIQLGVVNYGGLGAYRGMASLLRHSIHTITVNGKSCRTNLAMVQTVKPFSQMVQVLLQVGLVGSRLCMR
ncbi:hypothetical protein VSVS12_02354 [Vibrio scophthalmi]|uniref:hypothetical protein n=1 Tax=Vibrio scophthalmi TaxID=45658 RepID=UPI0008096024|nr:hypothetical protein [Vibrio scophthalmi]ANS86115.1 hypothetical protein VSVS12_02354 [Vibrio scophthalmi]